MKKKVIILSIIVIVIIAAGLFLYLKGNGKNTAYKTEKVSRGEIKSVVTATGTVNAVTTVSVGTQVSGTIKRLMVDYNSPVKKGQLLAQIDPSTFQAQVDQANGQSLVGQSQHGKSGRCHCSMPGEPSREAKTSLPRTSLPEAIWTPPKPMPYQRKPSRK